MIIKGGHDKACDYSQRVLPLGGQLTVEMRESARIVLRLPAKHDF
jgi:hypothetical protein